MLQFLLGGHSPPPPPPPPRRVPEFHTLTRGSHTPTRSSNRRVWGKSAGASQWPAAGRPVLSTAYVVDLDKLPQTPELAAASAALASTFLLSTRDAETDAFLDKCRRDGRDPAHVARERAGSAAVTDAQRLRGVSRTDAIALHLNHSMVVATSAQVRRLVAMAAQRGGGALPPPPTTLLDIGAGRGEVTAALAAGLGVAPAAVAAMENSAPLRKLLTAAGYRAVGGFGELRRGGAEAATVERFGAVALLNVLDRCDDPLGLLGTAARAVRPGGLLVVATVLPFCASVYFGAVGRTRARRVPRKPLQLPVPYRCGTRRPFEEQAAAFVAATVARWPALKVVAWTRVPYLSSGDARRTWYTLDNAVFVMRVGEMTEVASI